MSPRRVFGPFSRDVLGRGRNDFWQREVWQRKLFDNESGRLAAGPSMSTGGA
jgi:hypothetical protein